MLKYTRAFYPEREISGSPIRSGSFLNGTSRPIIPREIFLRRPVFFMLGDETWVKLRISCVTSGLLFTRILKLVIVPHVSN